MCISCMRHAQALKEASRRRAKSQGRQDADNITSDAAGNDEALDPIQQKVCWNKGVDRLAIRGAERDDSIRMMTCKLIDMVG